VSMHTQLVVRFEYGSVVPWVSRQEDGRLQLTAGPDRLLLDTSVALRGEDMRTVGEFEVQAGEEIGFALSWAPSFRAAPERLRMADALAQIESFWSQWTAAFKPMEEWSHAVLRSLLTLKALAHWETGGIIAAGTTSLPEKLHGSRNWDYRFCWLRDATFTLYALVGSGFLSEAQAWREWLLRAVAGGPDDLQIMYGVGGERRLTEYVIPWLPGYEGTAPVRVGNAAAAQVQLDVSAKSWTRSTSVAVPGLLQKTRVGRSSARSSRIWRKSGTNRMMEFGKSAAVPSTSRTPRSWRGLPSTVRCARRRSSIWQARLIDGGAFEPPFTKTCAIAASILHKTLLCSPTVQRPRCELADDSR